MNRYDGAYLARIIPQALTDYLDSTGWTEGDTMGNLADYHRETVTVVVPMQQEWRYYGTMVATLVGELARVEQRSTFELVADIRKAGMNDE